MDYLIDILAVIGFFVSNGCILLMWIKRIRKAKSISLNSIEITSLTSAAFGFSVWLKYGLMLNYGNNMEVNSMYANELQSLGLITIIVGVTSFFILIGRNLIVKKASA